MGYARGGKDHLRALERVRLDAADGVLDGATDVSRAQARQRALVDDTDANDPEPVPEALMWAAAERERADLPPRYGLHMKWLALWDVSLLVLLLGLFAPSLIVYDQHDWMFWLPLPPTNLRPTARGASIPTRLNLRHTLTSCWLYTSHTR